MTVERLIQLLQDEVDKGNGHMPIGIALDGKGMTMTAGLFAVPKIGVQEQYDTVWIVGKKAKQEETKKEKI